MKHHLLLQMRLSLPAQSLMKMFLNWTSPLCYELIALYTVLAPRCSCRCGPISASHRRRMCFRVVSAQLLLLLLLLLLSSPCPSNNNNRVMPDYIHIHCRVRPGVVRLSLSSRMMMAFLLPLLALGSTAAALWNELLVLTFPQSLCFTRNRDIPFTTLLFSVQTTLK